MIPSARATPALMEALSRLHAEAFAAQGARPWSADELFALISAGARLWVAGPDEAPFAFLLMSLVGDEAEVLTLCSVPGARRKGAARGLLRAARRELAAEGARAFILEVAADNEAALRLYAAEGFRAAGRRKAYYARPQGPRADALIMRQERSSEANQDAPSFGAP